MTTAYVSMPPFNLMVTAIFKNIPDISSPTVSLNNPIQGANVSGVVPISATAFDNIHVTTVAFTVDGITIGLTSSGPSYGITWHPTLIDNGPHQLSAKAWDAAGNVGISSPVFVTVQIVVPPAYHLDVVNGTGSGNYVAGTTVTIVANAPPTIQEFNQWVGPGVLDPTASTTNLIMPSTPAVVTATYKDVTYPITIINGAGSGAYKLGSAITIVANNPATGYEFDKWQTWPADLTIYDKSASSTTIVLTSTNVYVMALYKQISQPI
jgi:hypothetical protein